MTQDNKRSQRHFEISVVKKEAENYYNLHKEYEQKWRTTRERYLSMLFQEMEEKGLLEKVKAHEGR